MQPARAIPTLFLRPPTLSALFSARGAPPPLALAPRLRAALGPRALPILLSASSSFSPARPNTLQVRSTTGPSARNTSCSRTRAISAAERPSALAPPRLQRSRTFNQIVTNSATGNAEHACEYGGDTYM